ncbi:hypothetical protein K440DRAFT_216267 [Wilcoxina mikolae CBS 423.85]|nr:hypothetical protein K440DRAFT_216267 [Wilcoxina mikolae CBS 423.85]
MGAPKLSNSRVLLETATGGSAATKVISVSWELADSKSQPDGEWTVEWEDMYADLSEDVRSARSEQGGYFALQSEIDTARTPKASTFDIPPQQQQHHPSPPQYDEPLPTGPLSTARLLEFENGPNFPDAVQEDLPAFFASRPIVQAPTQILSDPTSVSKKTEVLFLLAPATPIPQSISIFFTPTWTPPNTPPTLLSEIRLIDYGAGDGLHTTWALKRLEDLQALQEIAKELEREGSRGIGQGRLKVGVEGGGMDEEAVRREGWMVGEEQGWVLEKFLTCNMDQKHAEEEVTNNSVMDPFAGLGISTGMSFAAASEEEEEEDLFALPLSPRSPDMAMSPFSMFRGEALGVKGNRGSGKRCHPDE